MSQATLQTEVFAHHQKTFFVSARLNSYSTEAEVFFSAAPKLWSELPDSVRQCESLDVYLFSFMYSGNINTYINTQIYTY